MENLTNFHNPVCKVGKDDIIHCCAVKNAASFKPA